MVEYQAAEFIIFYQRATDNFPDGLGVRIPDSHSGGPGSIPGQGAFFHSFFLF